METKIYLVRHTQTVGNIEKRLTGRVDFEVTEEGYQLVEKLTEKLKDIKFDVAYASTSKRTSKTIQKLADINGMEICEEEDLCEMYFGIYDGMTWEDVNTINPKISKLHKETNEIMQIPNQETKEQVTERMYRKILEIANNNVGKNILICSHGVAIEAFLRKITKVPFIAEVEKYSQKNTSLNIIEFDKKNQNFVITMLNNEEYK